GIDDHRQDAGVQAVLRWQADDLRIGDGNGNLDGGYRQARLDVGMEPFTAVVQQVGQAGQPAGEKHARVLSSASQGRGYLRLKPGRLQVDFREVHSSRVSPVKKP